MFLDELLQNPRDEQEKKIAEQFTNIGLYANLIFFRIIDNSISFGFKQEACHERLDSWTIKS